MTTLPNVHCVNCDHEWVPRVENPKLCPNCKYPPNKKVQKRIKSKRRK